MLAKRQGKTTTLFMNELLDAIFAELPEEEIVTLLGQPIASLSPPVATSERPVPQRDARQKSRHSQG